MAVTITCNLIAAGKTSRGVEGDVSKNWFPDITVSLSLVLPYPCSLNSFKQHLSELLNFFILVVKPLLMKMFLSRLQSLMWSVILLFFILFRKTNLFWALYLLEVMEHIFTLAIHRPCLQKVRCVFNCLYSWSSFCIVSGIHGSVPSF